MSRQLRVIATGTWAGTHLDGRTTGMGEGTMGRWIDRCPGCGYRAASIAKAPASAAKVVRSRAYRGLLVDPAMPMVARWYVCAATVAEADGAPASRAVVEYLLHASWACDDASDIDAASDCRARTAAALQAVREAGDRYRFDDASADWALLADLHRRSGRLLRAGAAARAGLELADSPFFRRLLELQLRLAELCDTDAHLYEEATGDAGVEPGEQVVDDTCTPRSRVTRRVQACAIIPSLGYCSHDCFGAEGRRLGRVVAEARRPSTTSTSSVIASKWRDGSMRSGAVLGKGS